MPKPILLLILLFAVCSVEAQSLDTVRPVVSDDYRALLSSRSGARPANTVDSSADISKSPLVSKPLGYFWGIKTIGTSGNLISLQHAHSTILRFGGTYTASVETKRLHRLPATQHQYVQGSNVNGEIVWQGPETNQMFSYGPSITELGFDGTAYPYDFNGRLVKESNGTKKAVAYNAPVLRNGFLSTHAISLSASVVRDFVQVFTISMRASGSDEQTIIKNNDNHGERFAVNSTATHKRLVLSAGYSYTKNRFSYSNRNGFLNRVYMNSLLTPISFDNTQGLQLPTGQQRSYSQDADNPFFLLQHERPAVMSDHTFNLALDKKGLLHLQLAQSFNETNERISQGFAPGTAFFPAGVSIQRVKRDRVYNLSTLASYEIAYHRNRELRSVASQRYIMHDASTNIGYHTLQQYVYHRQVHEFVFLYATRWRRWSSNTYYDLDLGNKIYLSNTAAKGTAFLPGITARIVANNFMDCRNLDVRFAATLDNFNSELPFERSMNAALLLQHPAADASRYFPAQEVAGYRNINAIRNKEFSLRIDADYTYQYSLHARLFIRKTAGDVFPSVTNGSIQLSNAVDHRTAGYEIEIDKTRRFSSKVGFNTSLSFLAYRSLVTSVNNKDQIVSIAGFADVYKAAVKGQPLGVIMGSTFVRNSNGQCVIGSDGFPLASGKTSVIGDPTPDFVMKWNNVISWKRLQFSADIEWRSGGDMWNGTRAVLDYYGRSASSARLRNTQHFVFDGVLQDGSKNTIPVSFYDPSKPFNENRWVRYGFAGIAEEYIGKADQVRFGNLSVSYQQPIKKYLRQLNITCYVSNLVLWSAYNGSDVNQLLYDMPGTNGLDFFNLPSTTSYGVNLSLQF